MARAAVEAGAIGGGELGDGENGGGRGGGGREGHTGTGDGADKVEGGWAAAV